MNAQNHWKAAHRPGSYCSPTVLSDWIASGIAISGRHHPRNRAGRCDDGGAMTVDELHAKMEAEFKAVDTEFKAVRAEIKSEAKKVEQRIKADGVSPRQHF